jgi:hypothetical protein
MSGSYREETAKHKAARQASLAVDAPRTRGVPNRRNTKRWCHGKVGVEHKLVVKPYAEVKGELGFRDIFKGWLIQYCVECGKNTATYHPSAVTGPVTPIPAWVAEHLAKVSAASSL